MTKATRFLVTTTWILFSRCYDAYCISRLTPDLSKESNPLVSVLGMDWGPLLFTVGLLTAYALYTYYLSVFKTIPLLPTEKGYSFSQFTAYLYLGKKEHWTTMFYKLPSDMQRFHQYMGHTLSRGLVFAGFVSTIMWLLINYTAYYKTIHSPLLIYTILFTGVVAVIYRWSREQYRQYLAV